MFEKSILVCYINVVHIQKQARFEYLSECRTFIEKTFSGYSDLITLVLPVEDGKSTSIELLNAKYNTLEEVKIELKRFEEYMMTKFKPVTLFDKLKRLFKK